jgi:acyl-CoA synthetase (AMP-forming)/AMP-acid ligase II
MAFRTLVRTGAVDPRSAAALVASLPWLLGRGPSLGILSRINARAVGSKTAIHDRHGSISWARLDRRAERVAGWLRGRGLGPGDRVATVLRNGREFVETILGAQKAGLVSCPLNTWARTGELAAILELADPSLLVTDARNLEQVEEAAPPGLAVVVAGDPVPGGRERYEDALITEGIRPVPPFGSSRGGAGIVIHTSGTTGRPKGAARPGGGGLGELMALLSVIPFRRDDVIVSPAPLFHSFGLLMLTLGTLLGATFVFPDRFDPEQTLALIQRHRGTAASMVPVMLRRILSLPEETRARHDVSGLRIVTVSGSATPPDLRDAASALFGPVLYDLYGSTEAGWVSVATPEDAVDHPASVDPYRS